MLDLITRNPRGEPPAILVMDDRQAGLEVVARVLERDGYRVLKASDGDQALAIDFEASVSALEVVVDPGKVTQVMNNLLQNAIRYAAPGTRIRVGDRETHRRRTWWYDQSVQRGRCRRDVFVHSASDAGPMNSVRGGCFHRRVAGIAGGEASDSLLAGIFAGRPAPAGERRDVQCRSLPSRRIFQRAPSP